jgi:hypothetical protein
MSSTSVNRTRDTAATIESRRIQGAPNQSLLLPSSSTVSSAPRPTAIVAMPSQSPRRNSPSCRGSGSRENHNIPNMTAPGRTLT